MEIEAPIDGLLPSVNRRYISYCNVFYCTACHCIAFYCIVLHYNVFHCVFCIVLYNVLKSSVLPIYAKNDEF